MKNSQKGFIGIVLLIILGLLVVGGGAYYFGNHQKIYFSAPSYTYDESGSVPKLNDYSNTSNTVTNSNTNVGNTVQANSSSTTTPVQGPIWKTYTDFGFSFNYPNNIILAPTGARSAVDFFLDNPSDANMVTFSADDPAATCNDMDNATGPNGVHNYKGEIRIINGVSFHKAESSEGFAGGSAHSIDYYTSHNNSCYDLRFSHTSYASALSESAAISMFDNIVSTFKFKN